MGKLSSIIFTEKQQKEAEVLGHKIVFKSLTTRDTLSLNLDYKTITGEANAAEGIDAKAMLGNMLEMLSASIVSIDGIAPDNKAETMEFLLNQEQATILELFSKSSIGGVVTAEEIKN
jgi:hypothetical protein